MIKYFILQFIIEKKERKKNTKQIIFLEKITNKIINLQNKKLFKFHV